MGLYYNITHVTMLNIEVAHIISAEKPGAGDIDNAIPLCFDCHGEIGRYNADHPKGSKYKPEELKARRDQIYEIYTRHLVPPIYFNITQDLPNTQPNTQKRILPDVGIFVGHHGTSLPVKVSVAVQVFLGNKDLGIVKANQYNGERLWNLNPLFGVNGHFPVPSEVVDSTEELEIRVSVTIIDQYERKHQLLPLARVYMRERNSWYLEPCGNESPSNKS